MRFLLISQFEELLDKINLDEAGVKQKFKTEVERFKKFQRVILGNSEKIDVADVDIRNYVRCIPREGTDLKKELLGFFKNKILLGEKKVSLESL